MNLFGFNISWNGNNKYVKQKDCHRAMDKLEERISELKEHIADRFEDLKDFILKNGK